ncbi:MAG TPA: OmpA family protein [Sedimenticola thiotaurini]|uniref:OmpA family protein n=1 Tax=Sedimenticola thiotaurini TaxID=1543721 RepID=A0A831RQ32_9GAMM|nr:OmpA family protein [Sedimenticola thiotaurini]
MHTTVFRILSLSLIIGVAGCASDDPNRQAKIGAGVGAVAGAIIGHQISHGSGKWIGAAVGALAGGAVGHYMDKQQQEFEQALRKEQEAHQLEIERLKDDTLKLSLDSEVSFDFNKAEIKPAFRPSLDKLADVLLKYDRTVVHVVGHTDSVGSEAYNQQLSERRARAVVDYLASRGVPYDRLRSEGRGESEPRATNATEAGRQLNRRVEIYVKPVVEGQEQKAYESPRY